MTFRLKFKFFVEFKFYTCSAERSSSILKNINPGNDLRRIKKKNFKCIFTLYSHWTYSVNRKMYVKRYHLSVMSTKNAYYNIYRTLLHMYQKVHLKECKYILPVCYYVMNKKNIIHMWSSLRKNKNSTYGFVLFSVRKAQNIFVD